MHCMLNLFHCVNLSNTVLQCKFNYYAVGDLVVVVIRNHNTDVERNLCKAMQWT